jgi:hypothetical protein
LVSPTRVPESSISWALSAYSILIFANEAPQPIYANVCGLKRGKSIRGFAWSLYGVYEDLVRLFISWEIPLSCVIWRPFGFLIFDCATDLLSSHGLTLTGLLMGGVGRRTISPRCRSSRPDRSVIYFGSAATRKSTRCGRIGLPVAVECLPPLSQNLPGAPSPPRLGIRARLR